MVGRADTFGGSGMGPVVLAAAAFPRVSTAATMSSTLLLCNSSVEKLRGEKAGLEAFGSPGGAPSGHDVSGGDAPLFGAPEARHFSGGSHSKDSGFSAGGLAAGRGAMVCEALTGRGAGAFGSGSRKKSRTRLTTLLKTLIAWAVCRDFLLAYIAERGRRECSKPAKASVNRGAAGILVKVFPKKPDPVRSRIGENKTNVLRASFFVRLFVSEGVFNP